MMRRECAVVVGRPESSGTNSTVLYESSPPKGRINYESIFRRAQLNAGGLILQVCWKN